MTQTEGGPIASPCKLVCVVDPVSRLCIGCGRSVGEITRWTSYTDAERAAIMADLDARLARMTSRAFRAPRARRRYRERDEAPPDASA